MGRGGEKSLLSDPGSELHPLSYILGGRKRKKTCKDNRWHEKKMKSNTPAVAAVVVLMLLIPVIESVVTRKTVVSNNSRVEEYIRKQGKRT